MISIFPLWTFHSYLATFQQHLHMEYIYLSVDTTFQSLWFLSGFPWLRDAANMEATEPSLRKFYGHHHILVDRYEISVSQITTICSTCRKQFPVLSSFMTYHGFVTRLTRRVSLVEQELYTLPYFSLYVCFVDRCLSFCTFSLDHCVVCSSSIYGFWLPLWFPQTLLKLINIWQGLSWPQCKLIKIIHSICSFYCDMLYYCNYIFIFSADRENVFFGLPWYINT